MPPCVKRGINSIIPVVEEVLKIERVLVLKEEGYAFAALAHREILGKSQPSQTASSREPFLPDR